MKENVTLICLLMVLASGCCTQKGLIRTSFENWGRKELKPLNISLELPVGKDYNKPVIKTYEKYVYEGVTNPAAVIVSMHYYHSGAFMAEPMAWLRVEIYQLSSSEYETYCSGRMYSFGSQELFFGTEFPKFCSEITAKTIVSKRISASGYMLPFLFYRKDYRAENNDVILVGAELWPGLLNLPSSAEDRKAVERILNSIQFLPDYGYKK